MHVLMESITVKASNDIITSSTSDRNDAAVVMIINLIKSQINASQKINASQSLKKVLAI